jgi:hypothetical protein
MWRVRAIRAGVLLGVLLATAAGSGCCHCCKSLWGGDAPKNWDELPMQTETSERGNYRFDDKPEPLTPERIHGGIQ